MSSSSQQLPATPHIVVIPFPAQGHMLPLLDLVHHLCLRHSRSSAVPKLTVTVIVTPKNAPFLDPLLRFPFPSSTIAIHPLVLPLPPHPSLPAGAENVKDLPFAGYNAALAHAVFGLHDDVLLWARSQTHNPPTAVLSDFFLGSLGCALAADLGVPNLAFFGVGALLVAVIHHLWARKDGGSVVREKDGGVLSFPDIPGAPSFTEPQLPALYRRYRAGVPEWEALRASMVANSSSDGVIINSCDAIEGVYLDHLRAEWGYRRRPVWAVGPLAPAEGRSRGGPSSVPAEELASWLDSCPAGSVVYVCFGSQYVIPRPHVAALAAALEKASGVRFLWAVKEPVGTASSVVPEGFEERVAGRGLVVRGWAPQVPLLEHAAVGAFLTHCGWNSVVEGVMAGVLLLTWPAEADQFINARLLVDELGVAARAWEGGHDAPAPDPGELAKVIAESVGDDGEGRMREVRRRAAELGRRAREAVAVGGSSDGEWELLLKEVTSTTTS